VEDERSTAMTIGDRLRAKATGWISPPMAIRVLTRPPLWLSTGILDVMLPYRNGFDVCRAFGN